MGYQPKLIIPPWKGVIDDVPSVLAPSSSFASATGFFIEKQRLRSVMNRSALNIWPDASGPVIGVRSFLDANGNIHTVVMTSTQPYYYVNGVYTRLYTDFTLLTVTTTSPSLTPVKTAIYQNVLIYTNGSGLPITIDGSAVSSTIALPNTGACFFVGTLAGSVLYLNLIEPAPNSPGAVDYPLRFRWSQVNNANNFSDFTAGVADIPEIEDNITGYATQGALGYIYRTYGITVLTPTGTIAPRFYVENYSAGNGLGNYFPYSLAQYGNWTVFASQTDINAFNPVLGPPQPIGGSSARSIYKDLNNAAGTVIGSLFGSLGAEQQGLQYWLAIPLADNTSVVWMYQFDSQSWTRQVFPFNVTCVSLVAVD